MFVIFLRRCVWKGLYLCRLRLSVMRLDMVNGIYCCNNQQTVRGLSVAAFQRQVLFKCTYSTHALVLSHRLIMDSFLDMRCCLLVYYWIFFKVHFQVFLLDIQPFTTRTFFHIWVQQRTAQSPTTRTTLFWDFVVPLDNNRRTSYSAELYFLLDETSLFFFFLVLSHKR